MCHVNRDSLTHCSQGSVAQLVEQRTSNPKVVGSNPTWATEFFNNSVGHFSVGYHHWCCPEDGSNIDICKIIEFLVDNIYVRFGGQLFRQMVGIPMGTNCAPLLADLFLYSYENEFLDKLIKEGKRKLARRFNLSYRYIDDLISFNNKRFKEFISDIYPKELIISETTESTSVASYLDLLFARDRSNNITTKLVLVITWFVGLLRINCRRKIWIV